MARTVIFGSGGFGREVRSAVLREGSWGEPVFATDNPSPGEIHADEIAADDRTIIAIGDPAARRQVAERIGGTPASFFAATALIGHKVEIGAGAILCDNTMVTASARIGRQFNAHVYSYVAHDCTIGDFVTLAPRATVNGWVTIGDGAYIGSGAILRDRVTIGSGAIIGMGAVVTKDVSAGATVVGNPARAMD